MSEYNPEKNWKECEKCKQKVPAMNTFLCKGQMVCEGCFMTATEGNTKFIDESKYPRRSRGWVEPDNKITFE